ncbi:hypothetical protein M2408_000196 [Sphingobacterium sp. BIGb0165]|nr:hypothetical protein [Sphingobacterium sp. BIGb0165]
MPVSVNGIVTSKSTSEWIFIYGYKNREEQWDILELD